MTHDEANRESLRWFGTVPGPAKRRLEGAREFAEWTLPPAAARGDVPFTARGGWFAEVTNRSYSWPTYGEPSAFAIYVPRPNVALPNARRAMAKGGDAARRYRDFYLEVPTLRHVIQRLLAESRATRWEDVPPPPGLSTALGPARLDFALEARVEPTLPDLDRTQATFSLSVPPPGGGLPTLLRSDFSFSVRDEKAVENARDFYRGLMPAGILLDWLKGEYPEFEAGAGDVSRLVASQRTPSQG